MTAPLFLLKCSCARIATYPIGAQLISEHYMYRIGVDESGTGAWAGCATVTAVLVDDSFKIDGLRDSKKISDSTRRNLVPSILEYAVAAHTSVMTVDAIAESHRGSWRAAIYDALGRIRGAVEGKVEVVVDGRPDALVAAGIKKLGYTPVFVEKADSIYPSVMAASILAKTVRNDAMLVIHAQYPEYEWDTNYGYGTARHREMVDLHGITVHHRPIRSLAHITKMYENSSSSVDWFDEP